MERFGNQWERYKDNSFFEELSFELDDVDLDPSKPKGWRAWEKRLEGIGFSPLSEDMRELDQNELRPKLRALINDFKTEYFNRDEDSELKPEMEPVIGKSLKEGVITVEFENNGFFYKVTREFNGEEITAFKVVKLSADKKESIEDLDIICDKRNSFIEYTSNEHISLNRLKNNIAGIEKARVLLNELIAPNMQFSP